jgi:transposase
MSKVWAKNSEEAVIGKDKFGFACVAVVAAIDVNGKLVSLVTSRKSIKEPEFKKMLKNIQKNMGRRKVYIFLDNLRLHHMKNIKAEARRRNQELVFNASYSSEFNPVERLWALAKHRFSRDIVTESTWKSQAEIEAIVVRSLLMVPELHLAKHVNSCI